MCCKDLSSSSKVGSVSWMRLKDTVSLLPVCQCTMWITSAAVKGMSWKHLSSLIKPIWTERKRKKICLLKQYWSPAALQGHWVTSCIFLVDPIIRAGLGKGPVKQISTRLSDQGSFVLSVILLTFVYLLSLWHWVMIVVLQSRTSISEGTS